MAGQANPTNVFEIYDLECQKGTALIQKCQEWGLIPKPGILKCPKCQHTLNFKPHEQSIDGYRWLCPNIKRKRNKKPVKCTHTQSIRSGTFFEQSHLKLWEVLVFVTYWLNNIELKFIKSQLKISDHTSTNWASYCREVCFDIMIAKKKKIGGDGKTVQIVESKCGKRKHQKGNQVEGQWVFGGIEVQTGEVFMVAVEDRGIDTLLPIIKEWILPGTTIISDYTRAYDCLSNEGYQHLKVNHSINFKDPETGAYTNTIESTWRHAKARLPQYHRNKEFFTGYLAKYMFLKMCRGKHLDPTTEFFHGAGQLYNPAQM